MRRIRFLVIATTALTALAATAAVTSAAAASPAQGRATERLWHPGAVASSAGVRGAWQLENSRNPTVAGGFLNAVSCPMPSACMAVGWYENATGGVSALAEREDSAGWHAIAAPAPVDAAQAQLQSVSCVSVSFCVAVGYFIDNGGSIHPLGERWDASTWLLSTMPEPTGAQGAGLFGVSCTATDDCWAVGTANTAQGRPVTLAQRWDGSAWRLRPVPNPAGAQAAQLGAVSCPATDTCVAVGSSLSHDGSQRTLGESLDASTWTVEDTATPITAPSAQLTGVSCPAPGACVAAGVELQGDGSSAAISELRSAVTGRWRVVYTPPPTGAVTWSFTAISCTWRSACTAVGASDAGATVERWDGRIWSVQTPNTDASTVFNGVSCATGTRCTAAGLDASRDTYPAAAVDAWNGAAWTVADVPGLPTAVETVSLAVSCAARDACTSVGFTTSPSNRTRTLAERWDGEQWRLQPMPASRALSSQLNGVACPSVTSCAAVGSALVAEGSDAPLALSWDGSAWAGQPVPTPSDATSGRLRAVACTSASACVAVGEYERGDGSQSAFAAHWDGTSWQLLDIASPSAATGTRLSSVSCAGASCVAVGNWSDARGRQHPLAEISTSSGWRVQSVPVAAGAQAAELSSVSCSAAGACTAVGSEISGADTVTLVEVRAGGTWSVQPSPNQPAAVSTSFEGVSCQAVDSCAAVGSYFLLGPTGHPLPPMAFAESWNGTRWSVRTVSVPEGANSSVLESASCAGGACQAVGYVFGSSGRQVSYAVGRRQAG